MSSIRLSPKHGLNPSIMQCFYCGADTGVAVPGLLKGDREAPRKAVWDMTPCNECAAAMKIGVIFCEVDANRSKGGDAPYRTGRLIAIREYAVREMLTNTPKSLEQVLKQRFCWISQEDWKAMGFDEVFNDAGVSNAKPH